MFANDLNIVGNEVDRVEPNSKLTDQIQVTSSLHFLNKSCNNMADQTPAGSSHTTEHLIMLKSYSDKLAPEVPDLAMVPKFLMRSSFVIPIPRSRIDNNFFSLSNLIYMEIIHDELYQHSRLKTNMLQPGLDC